MDNDSELRIPSYEQVGLMNNRTSSKNVETIHVHATNTKTKSENNPYPK